MKKQGNKGWRENERMRAGAKKRCRERNNTVVRGRGSGRNKA